MKAIVNNKRVGKSIWKNVAMPRSCLDPLMAKFRASAVKVVTLPAPMK